jgi:cyclopropane fatty-acyl-phospholipid synthase-like methyltransferase
MTTALSCSRSQVSASTGSLRISFGTPSTSVPGKNLTIPFVAHRGLYMNRWVFPGADASCALSWVVTQVESAGFEVKNVDVLGIHYSATLLRWYNNWVSNKDNVTKSYGEQWYRIWAYFLMSAIIISRNGGCSVFQLTLHKNLNSYPRVEGVKNHASLQVTPKVDLS